MTNFESTRPRPARWFPFVVILLILPGCGTIKPMRLVVDLQGSDPHAGLMEIHQTLRSHGFLEEHIRPDMPHRVFRVYSHAEYSPVGASIDAVYQADQLVVFLHQTDPEGKARPWVKDTFQRVHEAMEEIFGAENVQIVEIHRSLR